MSGIQPTIAFEAVGKAYGEAPPVLAGVSLAVPAGQFLAILGPSGSGKTTLLRLVNRLADPSTGAVRVEGEDVRDVDPIALRQRVGYVFSGTGVFPHMRGAGT